MIRKAIWNPYVIGALIGVLSWTVFVVVNNPIGMTTAISEVSGAVAMPIMGVDAVKENPYWAKTVPAVDYGTLFLVGTLLGAFLSSLLAKNFSFELVPAVWKEQFGENVKSRFFVAFVGGVIAMFGARLAGGCTSGHGISGTLQLALSSWVFFLVMFTSAILTAKILFRR